MFICKLESLDKSEGLINRTANRKIIDCYLPQDPLVINDEQTPFNKKEKRQTALKLNTAFERQWVSKTEVQYSITALNCVI